MLQLRQSVRIVSDLKLIHQKWRGQVGRIVKVGSEEIVVRCQGIGWFSDRVFDLYLEPDGRHFELCSQIRPDRESAVELLRAYELTSQFALPICTEERIFSLLEDAVAVAQESSIDLKISRSKTTIDFLIDGQERGCDDLFKATTDEQPAVDPDLAANLRLALHKNATPAVWKGIRRRGADDKDLLHFIAKAFGTMAGQVRGDRQIWTAQGGKRPRFWNHINGGTPTLEGDALVKAVRDLMEIPLPHQAPAWAWKETKREYETVVAAIAIGPEALNPQNIELLCNKAFEQGDEFGQGLLIWLLEKLNRPTQERLAELHPFLAPLVQQMGGTLKVDSDNFQIQLL